MIIRGPLWAKWMKMICKREVRVGGEVDRAVVEAVKRAQAGVGADLLSYLRVIQV